jgi:hypothetical protein
MKNIESIFKKLGEGLVDLKREIEEDRVRFEGMELQHKEETESHVKYKEKTDLEMDGLKSEIKDRELIERHLVHFVYQKDQLNLGLVRRLKLSNEDCKRQRQVIQINESNVERIREMVGELPSQAHVSFFKKMGTYLLQRREPLIAFNIGGIAYCRASDIVTGRLCNEFFGEIGTQRFREGLKTTIGESDINAFEFYTSIGDDRDSYVIAQVERDGKYVHLVSVSMEDREKKRLESSNVQVVIKDVLYKHVESLTDSSNSV